MRAVHLLDCAEARAERGQVSSHDSTSSRSSPRRQIGARDRHRPDNGTITTGLRCNSAPANDCVHPLAVTFLHSPIPPPNTPFFVHRHGTTRVASDDL